jgi:uncharacterized protein YjiS (DUF1127 family)
MTLQIGDTSPNLRETPVRFREWITYGGLRLNQRQGVMQHVIRHSQAGRAQAPHNLGGAGPRNFQTAGGGEAATIGALAMAVIAAARKCWRAYKIRRARIAAIHELHALDDRILKDIGVSRPEIDWVGSTTRCRLARALSILF